jgi:DNA-binding XRE family transcriptional regulator
LSLVSVFPVIDSLFSIETKVDESWKLSNSVCDVYSCLIEHILWFEVKLAEYFSIKKAIFLKSANTKGESFFSVQLVVDDFQDVNPHTAMLNSNRADEWHCSKQYDLDEQYAI